MFVRRRKCAYLLQVLILCFSSIAVANVIYDYHVFNSAVYENDPALSFTVTVTDEGFGPGGNAKVGFKFDNYSTLESTITHVYFDDGSLLNIDSFEVSGDGVSFALDKKGKNLPGGETLDPPFEKKADFSAGAVPAVYHNGIQIGEWLKIIFTLQNGRGLDEVISEIANGNSTQGESLRIGLHIQAIGPDSVSVSAINDTEPIPEPATITLLCLGGALFLKKSGRKSR